MKYELLHQEGIRYLSRVDPILASVIGEIEVAPIRPHKNHFAALAREIIRQQLSGRVADVIEARFIHLFTPYSSSRFPEPEEILAMPDEKIRTAGLSFSKISYIKNLAQAVCEGRVDFKRIKKLSDDEVIAMLTPVKGIGRWTAEMFLMFSLGRPDVFSYGDLGLRSAMQTLYKLRKYPSEKRALEISSHWSPYRTLACRYLWRSRDIKKNPIQEA